MQSANFTSAPFTCLGGCNDNCLMVSLHQLEGSTSTMNTFMANILEIERLQSYEH